MSEEIGSFLKAIDSLLQQCAAHERTQDAGYVLRTVHSLQNCITVLQDIVNYERSTGTGRLEELVLFLCCILQQCEHKLFTMCNVLNEGVYHTRRHKVNTPAML